MFAPLLPLRRSSIKAGLSGDWFLIGPDEASGTNPA
jgi:hypothetical protein